ncbi:hypothetical protein MTF65_20660 [Streptomyces sp. APSN-46.1]|uniref:hypothetical protein n=1 Tax=Streptomyces sp. APSN-46.1 TaxID=2929049 RepID=UPI001FB368CB|nr:hypothetical protein [Streptomyces sp. APSN-46.1]MCJ1679709.1 hypothetical protein [Streptomyces sp. APSN-46.1]
MARPVEREFTVTDKGTIVCFKSSTYDCVVVDANSRGRASAFLTTRAPTDSHDEDLAHCTREINRILDEASVKRAHHGPDGDGHRELAILITDRGPLLAWVRHAVDKDDPDAVAQALGIAHD